MSLQLILGNSGSGKSYELYKHIITASVQSQETRFLVIVPEQFTMQTQKELVRLHPRKGILNIDILSFRDWHTAFLRKWVLTAGRFWRIWEKR